MIVKKYGGSSLSSPDKIKKVGDLIIKRAKKEKVVVVVSAMGDTTDELIELTRAVSKNPSPREMDMILATGEQVSSSLLTMYLKDQGEKAVALTGFQAGIKTEDKHTRAQILDIKIENIKNHLDQGEIVIVAGFQGIDEKGDITTLGRGGSDTTAVALAAKLGCPCEIYTDVNGVYGVDPRVYSGAKKLDEISYDEMLEMASLGAKILDLRAVEMASKYGVDLYVGLNTGEEEGTYIKEYDEEMEKRPITGLTASDEDLMVTLINIDYDMDNIYGIFKALSDSNINIDMISQTAPINNRVNISFTAPKKDREYIEELVDLTKLKDEMVRGEIKEDITKISVVGLGMKTQSGIAARIFEIFAQNSIRFQQVTTSEIRISYTIDTKDRNKAISLIANEFGL